ncbi:MAG: DUF4124 domain-containing protein [Gammaproteobacteria bacterium]|jgi:hypothetical protein|nr:DUF4124 domain-containing protein [Gammaproteobacteria bacterium]
MKATAPILITSLLLGLLVSPPVTGAEDTIYKWVDEEGVVHYSTRPPDGVDFVEMGIDLESNESPPATDAETTSSEQRPAEPPEQPEMTEAEPDPEVVAERCRQARSNLENLTQRSNLTIRGDDGESRPLSDEEREGMIEDAQAFIDEWC